MSKSQTPNQYKILTTSSLIEFGERYVYYSINGLLIFMLINQYGMSELDGGSLVGTVLGMTYISALVGGLIAQKLLNYYRTAIVGSFCMLIGCIVLYISNGLYFLYIALALISLSSGLIKANMSSFVGRYYDVENLSDGHRDFGFNFFYMGINLGAFIGLFSTELIKNNYGDTAPFLVAIFISFFVLFLMFFGMVILKKYIKTVKIKLSSYLFALLILLLYVCFLFIVLSVPFIANLTLIGAVIYCLYILYSSSVSQDGSASKSIVALSFFVLSVFYWAFYFLIFTVILLFIDSYVNHDVFSFTLASTQFLSILSFFVIVFSLIIGKIWLYLSNNGKSIHDIDKFNLGFVFMFIAFFIWWLSVYIASAKVSGAFFSCGFIVLAISELCISAIGLSLITKLAPKGFVSLYMGIWLVTLGIGGKLSGVISGYINVPDGENMLDLAKKSISTGFIMIMISVAVVFVLILFIRKTIIKNLPIK